MKSNHAVQLITVTNDREVEVATKDFLDGGFSLVGFNATKTRDGVHFFWTYKLLFAKIVTIGGRSVFDGEEQKKNEDQEMARVFGYSTSGWGEG